jgi:hypothetical protein
MEKWCVFCEVIFLKYYLNLCPVVVTVLRLNYKNEGSVVFMEIISVKMIHPLCVLFKVILRNTILTQHIFRSSRLLVSDLLTAIIGHFPFSRAAQCKTYPCIYDWDVIPLQYTS